MLTSLLLDEPIDMSDAIPNNVLDVGGGSSSQWALVMAGRSGWEASHFTCELHSLSVGAFTA